jgi:hypothetical protein
LLGRGRSVVPPSFLDPAVELRLAANGCLRWRSSRPARGWSSPRQRDGSLTPVRPGGSARLSGDRTVVTRPGRRLSSLVRKMVARGPCAVNRAQAFTSSPHLCRIAPTAPEGFPALNRVCLPAIIAALALALCIFTSGDASDEHIVNGGLETGDAFAWTTVDSSLQAVPVPHTGTWAGQLSSDGANAAIQARQNFFFLPGQEYNFSGWFVLSDATTTVALRLVWLDPNDEIAGNNQTEPLTFSESTYTFLTTGTVVPPIGATRVQAEILGEGLPPATASTSTTSPSSAIRSRPPTRRHPPPLPHPPIRHRPPALPRTSRPRLQHPSPLRHQHPHPHPRQRRLPFARRSQRPRSRASSSSSQTDPSNSCEMTARPTAGGRSAARSVLLCGPIRDEGLCLWPPTQLPRSGPTRSSPCNRAPTIARRPTPWRRCSETSSSASPGMRRTTAVAKPSRPTTRPQPSRTARTNSRTSRPIRSRLRRRPAPLPFA